MTKELYKDAPKYENKSFTFKNGYELLFKLGKEIRALVVPIDNKERELYLFPKLTIIKGIAGKRMAGSKIKLSIFLFTPKN